MCDLFGLCSGSNGKATDLLHSFAGHSGRNPHGWGIAYYQGAEAVLKKKPEAAVTSKDFFQAIEEAESHIIISHIRHASRGEPCEKNCHPFTHAMDGRQWTFAHNGHIDGLAAHPRSGGETDSEAAFHLLLDHISAAAGDAYAGLACGIESLFTEYEFGRDISLNFLLSDGETLYAFNHHPEKPMYHAARHRANGRSLLVSTQALDSGRWGTLPEDRLFVMKNGEIAASSQQL